MAIRIIYRMPNVKAFKPHLYGQTLSIVFVCISLAFFWQSIGNTVLILSLLATFGLGVIIGWPFLAIVFLLLIWFGISGLSPTPNFGESFLYLARSFLVGYLFGVLFSVLYNIILNIFIKIIGCLRRDRNLIFGYEDRDRFNIIKSPLVGEEPVLSERNQQRQIYQYVFPAQAHPSPPNHPFTIAFISNPYYMTRNNGDWEPVNDPIMNDERLFYRSVGNALEAFEKDEVLGAPEIWSRVRIITLFLRPLNPDQNPEDYAFAGGSSYVYNEPLLGYDDIISPISFPDKPVRNPTPLRQELLRRFPFLAPAQQQIMNDIDVIFYLTANTEFIRSSARPSRGAMPGFRNQPYQVHGIEYEHESLSEIPGLVALNVLYARQKTYIHEFGHAMAHATNGCIVDEYHDRNNLSDVRPVNCLLKLPPAIAVPKPFGSYVFPVPGGGQIDYHSDRDHPSNAEHWQSYFPRREAKEIGCIMDRTIGPYQFDRLLSTFMYDRLIAKINR